MEKVLTAKKTEQVLNEEIKSSIKEALKEAHFKQTAVGARLAGESTKERMKQIARAEVLKKNEYPEFMGGEGTADEKRVYNKLVKLLEGAEKGLKFLLGDNFIAISLCGSWAKGYAKRKSDVDLYLLLKYENAEVNDALAILHYMEKTLKVEVAANPYYIEEIKWLIGKVDNPYYIEEIKGLIGKVDSRWEKTDDAPDAAIRVFAFFSGKVFGDDSKIHTARKEIIEELAKSPYGDVVWNWVRIIHYIGIVGLARRHDQTVGDVTMRLGVTMEDFHEILKARGSYALPSFEEMKKQYGVT